jgi:hypothetical protein
MVPLELFLSFHVDFPFVADDEADEELPVEEARVCCSRRGSFVVSLTSADGASEVDDWSVTDGRAVSGA